MDAHIVAIQRNVIEPSVLQTSGHRDASQIWASNEERRTGDASARFLERFFPMLTVSLLSHIENSARIYSVLGESDQIQQVCGIYFANRQDPGEFTIQTQARETFQLWAQRVWREEFSRAEKSVACRRSPDVDFHSQYTN